jgi:hypothetical protein
MSCCSDAAVINGGYTPLSQRLLEYGMDAYSDLAPNRQRVIMWVFIFYDQNDQCPTCKQAFDGMFSWFNKYHLLDDPVRCVRTVVEPEPEKNLIFVDRGSRKLPMVLFCNEKGMIFDELFEFPGAKWLEEYILPYIQNDGRL